MEETHQKKGIWQRLGEIDESVWSGFRNSESKNNINKHLLSRGIIFLWLIALSLYTYNSVNSIREEGASAEAVTYEIADLKSRIDYLESISTDPDQIEELETRLESLESDLSFLQATLSDIEMQVQ